MSFREAIAASRIIETIDNYSVSNDTRIGHNEQASTGWNDVVKDEDFWRLFIAHPDQFFHQKMTVHYGVVSDWIARVPGLYWLEGSTQLRNVPEGEVEYRSDKWIAYSPRGKSSKVMGGLGTFLLPPDDEGKTIVTISPSCNASTGIPVLLYPEVAEHHRIRQGDLLTIDGAYWRPMSQEWSQKFESVKQIRRGYLVVDKPEQIHTHNNPNQPVEIHPCTVMEYQSGNALLYDYVLCSIDTGYTDYRQELQRFFKDYCTKNGRFGKYLIAADSTGELFEAEYNSPAELRRNVSAGRSQLNLLVERIQNSFYHRGHTISSIMEKIPALYITPAAIQALAVKVGIPPPILPVSSAANMSSDLVNICVERKMLETLVDQIVNDIPSSIN